MKRKFTAPTLKAEASLTEITQMSVAASGANPI